MRPPELMDGSHHFLFRIQTNQHKEFQMIESTNPLTNNTYSLKTGSDDKKNIDSFLSNNKKPVVVIQGLGFVGAVMSLVCANAFEKEYAVIGVDLPDTKNYWKIQSINEGVFPLVADDPKIDEYYQSSREKNNFYATYDTYAYSKADVIVVDINLDVDKSSNYKKDIEDYNVNLEGFKKAVYSIGENCKPDVLILIETTVPPGTCDKVAHPILKSCLRSRGLPTDQLRLGHSYERVMPGPGYIDSIQNFFRVYSGIDERSADATELFLKTIIRTDCYPLTRLATTTATEMAKVLENSYRAINIAFIVEWSRFAEESGVNLYEIVNAIRKRPTHANMMLPGIGVGGYCLTKDPLLASWARLNLLEGKDTLNFSETAVETNDKMPIYAFDFLTHKFKNKIEGKNIVFFGVSYRNEIGDTRYTPVETLYNLCRNHGANIKLHDPYLDYWEETKQPIEKELNHLIDSAPDILIISTGHKVYSSDDFFRSLLLVEPTFIYDTIGIWSNQQIKKLQATHTVKVLGRGDL